jgi:hypothetical protein
VVGPYTDIFKQNFDTLPYKPSTNVSIAFNWVINEANEREIIRVSIVNEQGYVLFDSVIQPSKAI